MRPRSRIEAAVAAVLVGGALVVAVVVTLDAWGRVGTVYRGFALMENLQVGVGGAERGPLEPFGIIRALNGRPLTSVREIDQEVARHPPGTALRYTVKDCCRSTEVAIPTRLVTWLDFKRFLVDSLVPGLLLLGMGALVLALKPGLDDIVGYTRLSERLDADPTRHARAAALTALGILRAEALNADSRLPEPISVRL
jgi:hypothetical protein